MIEFSGPLYLWHLSNLYVTLGVFFDIEGAFDNTIRKSVSHALNERKVHRSICNWITTMLQCRTILVKTDTLTLMVLALRGLPSPLSVTSCSI